MKGRVQKENIRKGDVVRAISGEERGKEGAVLRLSSEKRTVIVERLNVQKKAIKPSQSHPKGGIVELEGAIHLSNVMIVCKGCNRPARIGKKVLPDGKKLRVCKRCGDALDKEA